MMRVLSGGKVRGMADVCVVVESRREEGRT